MGALTLDGMPLGDPRRRCRWTVHQDHAPWWAGAPLPVVSAGWCRRSFAPAATPVAAASVNAASAPFSAGGSASNFLTCTDANSQCYQDLRNGTVQFAYSTSPCSGGVQRAVGMVGTGPADRRIAGQPGNSASRTARAIWTRLSSPSLVRVRPMWVLTVATDR